MSIELQIQETLEALLTLSRDDFWESDEIGVLRNNRENFLQAYKQNGTIASLTHRVLMNREVAHPFSMAFRGVQELWEQEEVQRAFAEGLRLGDSLLVDVASFVPGYVRNPLIQEAIAYNIATCRSMLFQVNIASAMGLYDHPKVKEAILSRKDDIIQQIKDNWHVSSLVSWTPYLIEDEEVKQAILKVKPNIAKAIRRERSLVDAAVLIQRVDWIRNDDDILKAVRDRLLDRSVEFAHCFMRNVGRTDVFYRYPELMEALDARGENTKAFVLGL